MFFRCYTVAVENQADQEFSVERADKDISLPVRKHVSRVEQHSARADVRIPIVNGLLGAVLYLSAVADHVAGILAAVGNVRPAVIFSGADNIDLVATHGTVFILPEFSRCGIDRQAFGIAMAVGIGFRENGGYAEERIVLGDRTVGIDARDSSGEITEDVGIVDLVIGGIALRVVQQRAVGTADEESAVGSEGEAAFETVDENLDVLEALFVVAQAGAGGALGADRMGAALCEREIHLFSVVGARPDGGRFSRWRREIGEIYEAILDEVRVGHHVVQAAGADSFYAGKSGGRREG